MGRVISVDPKLKVFFDTMPGAWGCKDHNSNFIYANEEFTRVIGFKHHTDIIGLSDFDMPCDTVNCAHLFVEQDKQVMATSQSLRILDIHPFAGNNWQAYIFTKTPLVDDRSIVIGTIFHGTNITNSHTIELGSILSKIADKSANNDLLGQNSYMLGNKFDKVNLSDRQAEILFYLLRGKTIKQSAQLLDLSPRTAENYLEQLKNKFGVANRFELIEKAISEGYLNVIPIRLLTNQLSAILKD